MARAIPMGKHEGTETVFFLNILSVSFKRIPFSSIAYLTAMLVSIEVEKRSRKDL